MEYASRSIPTAVKRAVLERDGMVCQWCGRTVVLGNHRFQSNYLHFDHVKPWGAGGDHAVDNLVVSCASCNLGRPKPSVNIRLAQRWVEYRHGRYWWPDDFTPPLLVPPNRCAHLLREYALNTRAEPLALVRAVHQGKMYATGQGEPVAVAPLHEPRPEPLRRRRRVA